MEAVAGVLSDCCVVRDGVSSRSYVITSFSTLLFWPFSGNIGPHETAVVKACHLTVCLSLFYATISHEREINSP